jgi:hypothetical protein
MRERRGNVKQVLCSPIIQLNQRFDVDFAWLAKEHPSVFSRCARLVDEVYDRESQVLELANSFVSRLLETAGGSPSLLWSAEASGIDEAFAAKAAAAAPELQRLIDDYIQRSEETVRAIESISWEVDERLVPIEARDVSRNPGYTPPSTVTAALSATPQADHRHLYTLLAVGFGVAALVALMVLVVVLPEPTPYQQKVFGSVLALGAAGFGTTLTGLLNVKLTLGKQLAAGGTGALAIFLLVYFFNPAAPSVPVN